MLYPVFRSRKCPATAPLRPRLTLLVLLCFGLHAYAQPPVPLNGASVDAYYDFAVAFDAALISFDWDASGALHYTVGDPNFGFKLEVYRRGGDDTELVFASSDVWPGSRITCIDNYVYFNDSGDFSRMDANYYLHSSLSPGSVTALLESPYGASLWGVAKRNTGEFFASGSAAAFEPAALFYSPLDETGHLESTPPVLFAVIGESPGPKAFGPDGALYYVPGFDFSGSASVYRWSAQAVQAALADPVNSSLSSTGAEWAELPQPYAGATGMAVDSHGNVYVTVTAWGSPSQLVVFTGAGAAMPVIEYDGRLETVRHRENGIYFSCADGVFQLPLLNVDSALDNETVQASPGETVIFAVEAGGGIGPKTYQWYRVGPDKSAAPVGSGLAHYSMTAQLEDDGAYFYCVVTDDVFTVESPLFTLTVELPVPLSSLPVTVLLALTLALLGVTVTQRLKSGKTGHSTMRRRIKI